MRVKIKSIIIASIILGIFGFSSACASSSAPAITPSSQDTASTTTSTAFKVDSLAVNPAEVNAGIEALITARITNTGDTKDSYIGKVKIINAQKASLPTYLYSDEVTISPGVTQILSVATTINYPGTYQVNWDGVSQKLLVNEAQAKAYIPQSTGPIMAPDFTAVDVVTGKTVSLSQFKGTPVLLNFVNYGCSPSVNDKVSAQLLAIKQLYQQRTDFVPVSVFCGCCPPEVLRQFAQQNNLNWPWILDSDNSIVAKYSSYVRQFGYPTLLFVDKSQYISEIAGYSNLVTLTEKLNKIAPIEVIK